MLKSNEGEDKGEDKGEDMGRRGHGEGTIYRRADERWVAQLSLEDGQRKTLYGRTRQEVVRRLAQAQRDLQLGLPLADERQTLAQYLEGWLETIAPTLRPDTVQRHREYVELHIVPGLGRHKLARLTPQQVQAFYADRLATGLASTTVNHMHATLHKALESAVRLGIIPRNVSDLVEVPRVRESQMHVLSREEARRLLDAVSGHRLEALFALALATGMRQGELLALHWREVDLEDGVLRVRATLKRNKRTGEWLFAEPKTRRSRRQIALAGEIVATLRQHRMRQAEERLRAGSAWQDMDLVFCSPVGEPLSARGVVRQLEKVLARAGVSRIRFHDLRHTAATLLLAARVNPKIVSEMLGHASISITLDIYSHVLPDMQQDAASVMGAVLYG